MKLLAVCESPPTLDPSASNGSTLIAAHVLSRLPVDVEICVVYFTDRVAAPEVSVTDRAVAVHALPIRDRPQAAAAQPFTRLPRATWQRTTSEAVALVSSLGREADVVLLHGLHTFGLAAAVGAPIVANEIDPWSDYWRQRALLRPRALRGYDIMQARRAERLERLMAASAAEFVVVSQADASRMSARLHREVVAVPNGVDFARRPVAPRELAQRQTIAFVGTLDYPPNVAAAVALCRDVVPLIRRRRPDLRVVLAGRRPVAAVRELVADGVEVHADVPDMWAEMAAAAVLVFPGTVGQGVKNTVTESITVGRPVVTSISSARGQHPGLHLVVADTPAEQAAAVLRLLDDDRVWNAACDAAETIARELSDWTIASRAYDVLLRRAESRRAPS